jgi:CheY-like chemotaxis protein
MLDFFHDALQHVLFSRQRKSLDLQEALCRIFSRRRIQQICKAQPDGDLLALAARKFNWSACQLLESAAEELGMTAVCGLEAPSPELLAKTGFPLETLQRARILPCPSVTAAAGYALVVADPSAVHLEDFEAEGIPVLLGLASEIDTSWLVYDPETAPRSRATAAPEIEQDIQEILGNIARDAAELGAAEVFLGHPHKEHYEFSADEKRFGGYLHQSVYDRLCSILRLSADGRTISVGDRTLRLALTRNFQHLIICVSWKQENPPHIRPPARPVATRPPVVCRPSPALSGSTSDASRILLVDDDDRFSFVLSTILESKGFTVARLRNGQEALRALEENTAAADVIVCDVHMPELDGVNFVSALRSSGSGIPVCMLTSDEDQLLEAELALLGANAYVRKREDPRVLLAWIHNLLALDCLQRLT